MLLYNSLTRRKEQFEPVVPGNVRMYVCGITAYDYCHIGHARSAVVFDVMTRHLRNSGFSTLFIRNFTNIDDKIINRANKENRDWREVSQTYINAFHEDMEKLGNQKADLEPRATDYIQQIIDLCQKLIAKGHAYSTNSGDVYFRVESWQNYGKLAHRNLEDMIAGARVAPGEEKQNPLDFALWKATKPGEPAWPSPWGAGRPGWHIECSAMNQPFLPLDIHGGGQDLLFPHHENEIAQSEAAFDCQLAKYWVHNGFVRIDEEKMSKSLGNFFTIREILNDWLPQTLRFFLLSKHYRSPIDFSFQGLAEAEKAQQRVYLALNETTKTILTAKWKQGKLPPEIVSEWQELSQSFAAALDDDLNTAQALGHIFSSVRLINRLLEDKQLKKLQPAGLIFEEFLARARNWNKELGLFGERPQEFLDDLKMMRIKRNKINMDLVNSQLDEREKARKNRDFAKSDEIREQLGRMKISVRDTPDGQIWDFE